MGIIGHVDDCVGRMPWLRRQFRMTVTCLERTIRCEFWQNGGQPSWRTGDVYVSNLVFGVLRIKLAYHRLLTHCALTLPKWLEKTSVVLGAGSLHDVLPVGSPHMTYIINTRIMNLVLIRFGSSSFGVTWAGSSRQRTITARWISMIGRPAM